jgi:hypothetical protein
MSVVSSDFAILHLFTIRGFLEMKCVAVWNLHAGHVVIRRAVTESIGDTAPAERTTAISVSSSDFAVYYLIPS